MKTWDAIAPGVLWLWLFWHLHYEWSLNAQYNYGWGVPFLAAFLFYLRWSDRPAPQPFGPSLGAKTVGWALLALMLPIRMIEEANPDWRLLSWVFALAVVGYSLLALGLIGGSPWIRHFVFPVCFPLVAVPWLVQLENMVVQRLTRAVAYAAVEIAGWIGVGAYQIGNVIELHNGLVGVDEACSGVKTLQAAIMVTLLLGELLLLSAGRRVALLMGGCAWVFVCNVLRATVLVVIAAKEGTPALGRWHDSIGTVVVVVGMAGLIGLGWLLRGSKGDAGPHRSTDSSSISRGSPPMLLGSIAWLVVVFAVTESWYRAHEPGLVRLPEWRVRSSPPNAGALQQLPIADSTRAILRYNEATSAGWENPSGVHWWSFFARWEPQRAALQLVRSHSPEICLPAVGRIFRRERSPILIETGVLSLRFRVYEFEQHDRPLFVFVCIQEDQISQGSAASLPSEWNTRGRLLAVWQGQRNLGQRLLEVAVIGFDDSERAGDAFAQTAREIVE